MIRLYYADVRELTDPDISLLSVRRRNSLTHTNNAAVYRESAGVELLLLRALELEGRGLTPPLRFTIGPMGKPELADADFHISLAHSNGFVLCATADSAVGADIELRQEVSLKLAERFFSPDECRRVLTANDFLRIWVKKESYVKASGMGFAQGFENFSVFDRPDCYHLYRIGKLYLAAFSDLGEACAKPIKIEL